MPIAYLEPVSNTQRLRKIVRVLRAHSVLPRRKLVDIAQRSENETPVVDVADDLDVIGLLEHRCAEVQPEQRFCEMLPAPPAQGYELFVRMLVVSIMAGAS